MASRGSLKACTVSMNRVSTPACSTPFYPMPRCTRCVSLYFRVRSESRDDDELCISLRGARADGVTSRAPTRCVAKPLELPLSLVR
jgi:hypothetical protein